MSGFRGKTLDAEHLAKGMKFDFGRGVLNLVLRRHAMFVDQKTESVVVPLNTALSSDGKLELANSL